MKRRVSVIASIVLATALTLVGCPNLLGPGGGDGPGGIDFGAIADGFGRIIATLDIPESLTLSDLADATVRVVGQAAVSIGDAINSAGQLVYDVAVNEIGSRDDPGAYQLLVSSAARGVGFKIDDIGVTEGQESDIGPAVFAPTGSIAGQVTLRGATDYTGIDVYIPGTSFAARTNATGNFTMTGVPAGTYETVRAETDGYHPVTLSDVVVTSSGTTTIPSLQLIIDTGASGAIEIDGGALYTTSLTVTLSIWSSNDAVLMMLSEANTFDGASWRPVASAVTFTFTPGNGERTVYIKFANANGLESSPVNDSITVNADPSAISSATPADGDTVVTPLPSFTWTEPALPAAVLADTTYDIQLARDSAFSDTGGLPLAGGLASASYDVTFPIPSYDDVATLYWRVRANLPDGTVGAWASASFILDSRPTADAPSGIVTVDAGPVLSWSGGYTGGVYDVQVATDSGGLAVVFSQNDIASTSFDIPDGTLSDGDYWWRVRAVTSDGIFDGAWSDAGSFSVNTQVAPQTPNSSVVSPRPTFDWAVGASTSATYDIRVSANGVDWTIIATGLTGTSYTPLDYPLQLDNQSYQWAIRAVDDSFVGGWSSPLTFTLDTRVTLDIPAGGASFTDPNRTYVWSGGFTGGLYNLQVASDSGFANIVINQNGLTTASFDPGAPLPADGTYYYRVAATSDDGTSFTGEWSPVSSFTIDSAPTTLSLLPADVPVTDPQVGYSWAGGHSGTGVTYDLRVSANLDPATSPVVSINTASSSHTPTGYPLPTDGTTYYWMVRAVEAGFVGDWSAVLGFTLDTGPTAVSPSTTVSDPQVAYVWTGGNSGADVSYEVQVSADGGTTWSPVAGGISGTATTYSPSDFPLQTDVHTYQWQVRAVEGTFTGDWSTPAGFTLDTRPTLLSPDGASPSNDPGLAYSWSGGYTGGVYHLQVTSAADTSFSGPVIDQAGISATSFDPTDLPLTDGDWIWRVAATSADGASFAGDFTATGSFTVDTRPTLTPLSPALTSDPTPTLDWSDTFVGAGYQIQIDDDSGFGSPAVDTTVTSSTFTSGSALAEGLWYWRVRSYVAGDLIDAAWSASSSFEVDTTEPIVTTAMVLDAGAPYTFDATVQVTSAITDQQPAADLQMMISESSIFTGASWQSYASPVSFSLAAYNYSETAEDVRTVYIKYRDSLGNTTAAFSDTIVFDPNVYVSTVGSDTSGTGHRDAPVATIEKANEIAATISVVDVRVAAGTYTFVDADTDGDGIDMAQPFNLLGGYDASFSTRDSATNVTTLTSAAPATMVFTGSWDGKKLDGFTINNTSSLSDVPSVTVFLNVSSVNLTISNNTISGNTTNATLVSAPSYEGGSAAIRASYASPTIEFNTIHGGNGKANGNSASWGSAGIVLQNTSAIVRNNTINGGGGTYSTGWPVGAASVGVYALGGSVFIAQNTEINGGTGVVSSSSNRVAGSVGILIVGDSATVSNNALISGGSGTAVADYSAASAGIQISNSANPVVVEYNTEINGGAGTFTGVYGDTVGSAGIIAEGAYDIRYNALIDGGSGTNSSTNIRTVGSAGIFADNGGFIRNNALIRGGSGSVATGSATSVGSAGIYNFRRYGSGLSTALRIKNNLIIGGDGAAPSGVAESAGVYLATSTDPTIVNNTVGANGDAASALVLAQYVGNETPLGAVIMNNVLFVTGAGTVRYGVYHSDSHSPADTFQNFWNNLVVNPSGTDLSAYYFYQPYDTDGDAGTDPNFALADVNALVNAQDNRQSTSTLVNFFVDPDPAVNNFRLSGPTYAADAIDFGLNTSPSGTASVTTDIDGEVRPKGSAYDIGYDEY